MNIILTCYHVRCYPYLGLVSCAIRRISWAFIDFINEMYLPWYPYLATKYLPIYASLIKFKYCPIMGKYSASLIMNFIDKGADEEKYESSHNILLDSFVENTAQTIQVFNWCHLC